MPEIVTQIGEHSDKRHLQIHSTQSSCQWSQFLHIIYISHFSCFLQFSSILTDHQYMNVILAFKSLMESMKLCCHILRNQFCREKREWNSKRITNMKLTNARKMCCKNGSKKERLPVIEVLMNLRYCLNNILWVEKQQKITLNPQDSSEGKAMAAL